MKLSILMVAMVLMAVLLDARPPGRGKGGRSGGSHKVVCRVYNTTSGVEDCTAACPAHTRCTEKDQTKHDDLDISFCTPMECAQDEDCPSGSRCVTVPGKDGADKNICSPQECLIQDDSCPLGSECDIVPSRDGVDRTGCRPQMCDSTNTCPPEFECVMKRGVSYCLPEERCELPERAHSAGGRDGGRGGRRPTARGQGQGRRSARPADDQGAAPQAADAARQTGGLPVGGRRTGGRLVGGRQTGGQGDRRSGGRG